MQHRVDQHEEQHEAHYLDLCHVGDRHLREPSGAHLFRDLSWIYGTLVNESEMRLTPIMSELHKAPWVSGFVEAAMRYLGDSGGGGERRIDVEVGTEVIPETGVDTVTISFAPQSGYVGACISGIMDLFDAPPFIIWNPRDHMVRFLGPCNSRPLLFEIFSEPLPE